MQFTDAVIVAGNPPVSDGLIAVCKNAMGEFAQKHGVPLPLQVDWRDVGDRVEFTAQHHGRQFGIAALKG